MAKQIAVLAFSGGLDTSFCVPWLREQNYDVVTVTVNTGGFDADEVLTLAKQLGNVSMFAAPTMVRRLLDAAKKRGETGEGIRTIVYGGGPMYLADIREAAVFNGSILFRQFRLSVVPLTDEQYDWLISP